MKKKLLLIVLALAILTSLTAGTLAVYTRQVLDTTAEVTAKRFACSAAGSVVDAAAIKLAPSESMSYKYTIANFDVDADGKPTGSPAEVDLRFAVSFNFEGAYEAMSGLKAELKDSSGNVVATNDEGKGTLSYNGAVLAKDAKNEATYTLTLTWVDDKSNASHTATGEKQTSSNMNIDIVATQEI